MAIVSLSLVVRLSLGSGSGLTNTSLFSEGGLWLASGSTTGIRATTDLAPSAISPSTNTQIGPRPAPPEPLPVGTAADERPLACRHNS